MLERVNIRRARRTRIRRTTSAALVVVVVAATVAGFSILTDLFDPGEHGVVAGTPYSSVGAIVICGDEAGSQICRIDAEALARGAGSDDWVRLTDLGSLVSEPAVSTDGTTVVFERHDPMNGPSSLWTIRTDGAELERLGPPESGLADPSWSPEGLIVAVADEGGPDGTGPAELAILDPDAGPDPVIETIELPGLSFPSAPSFSPDGTQILFVAGQDPNGVGADVYTIDIHDSNLTNLTRTARSEWTAVWSPDGQRIAFAIATGSGEELFTCPLDCVNPRRLDDPSGGAIYGALPAWSPDGDWLAFEVVADDQTSAIQVARLDGSDVRTIASPASGFAWIPVHETNSPEPSIAPDLSASAETEGLDIGLGVPMCDLEVLEGIDWDGTGIDGSAWTGAPVDEDGRCASSTRVQHVVAVDRDGDGFAEQGSTSTLRSCLLCRPFDTVDLNDDGVLELVVLEEASSTPTYAVYEVNRPGSERSPGVYPIIVVAPGAPAMNLDASEAVRFTVGGDEGFSGSIECEDAGAGAPILRYTWVRSAVDADTELRVDITRLSFGEDGVFHIQSVDRFTVPRNPEPTDLKSTEPACGVDFHPAA